MRRGRKNSVLIGEDGCVAVTALVLPERFPFLRTPGSQIAQVGAIEQVESLWRDGANRQVHPGLQGGSNI